MRTNKTLLKDTQFENESENFKFLLGHRLLLLSIPSKVSEYLERKKRKTNTIQPSDNLSDNEIDPEIEKQKLITKLNNYSDKFEFRFKINVLNVSDFETKNGFFTCKVSCPFSVCTISKICTLKSHWLVSNFTNHVRNQYIKDTLQRNLVRNASENIRRISDNSELDEILRFVSFLELLNFLQS